MIYAVWKITLSQMNLEKTKASMVRKKLFLINFCSMNTVCKFLDFLYFDFVCPVFVVRQKVRELLDFIQDDDKLRDERKKAKKNKDKYIGMSAESMGYRGGGGGGGYSKRFVLTTKGQEKKKVGTNLVVKGTESVANVAFTRFLHGGSSNRGM